MKVTSKQIAELCGVTRGTVDRALNNRPGINEATREKIMKVAGELGYRPHFLAQSLVKGETKTLGVVLFDVYNRIFSQLFHSFEAEARRHGYFVYLVLTNKDKALEMEYINNLLDRKVDGIALSPVNMGTTFNTFLKQSGVPIVTFANRVSAKVPFVWIDDKQAMKTAVHHIGSKGYKRILYVSPPLRYKGKSNIYVPEQRHQGFLEACAELPDIRYTVITDHDYMESMLQLIAESDEKPAILCSSDIYALDMMRFLKANHIRVPEQAGIMGFDNIDILHYVDPALTTIDFHVDEIGRIAAEQLIASIQGRDIPQRTNVAYSIIERDSL
ncbi:LacI family DNA-binding transcriptional regulator [Paenibacillus sp. CF384]|uniref:LacI family DNA-binding transcriptional regulator n=1 Tax=Paenibacillus sp. CF384 TaxID=1884382 RepID=UPI000896C6AD|nr:LacI family DNA-binding transcriptional regulator [Paenibacillus sp. CF384]SDX38253.1 transcriptional regulator, LacI family [Paenibacillus sp. CF384]